MLRPCNTKGKLVEINYRVFPKNLYIFAGFAHRTGNCFDLRAFHRVLWKLVRRCLMAPRAFNISVFLIIHIVLFKRREKIYIAHCWTIVNITTLEKLVTFYREEWGYRDALYNIWAESWHRWIVHLLFDVRWIYQSPFHLGTSILLRLIFLYCFFSHCK